jgi:hypothetical protein
MSETVVVHDEEGTGYRFSWGLTFAGAVVAAAVTLFLLTLGAGVGLLLMHPLTSGTPSVPHFLTGGAIYFLAAQAFGFAVGGHVAGRLLGPLPESHFQEEVRAAIHGLVVWALAVLGTVLMLAAAGAATAALYGINKTTSEPQHAAAIIVDRLFRPGPEQTVIAPTNPTAPAIGAANPVDEPAATITVAQPAASNAAHARAEAGRLIDAAAGSTFTTDDRARLTQLVSQQAWVSPREASLRVAATESQLSDRMRRTAEAARKGASYTSLWIAFSLLFGAVVAMVAAVTARLEDDRESAWTLFAFHRGWRS